MNIIAQRNAFVGDHLDSIDAPRDWKVEGEVTHPAYVSKVYNGLTSTFPADTLKDIDSVINDKLTVADRREDNNILSSQLTALDWKREFRKGTHKDIRLDFVKNRIGMEVQFRQDTNLLYNLLSLELAYQHDIINRGIMVTYNARTAEIVGENAMNASFQALDRIISEFKSVINFKIPLLSVEIRWRTHLPHLLHDDGELIAHTQCSGRIESLPWEGRPPRTSLSGRHVLLAQASELDDDRYHIFSVVSYLRDLSFELKDVIIAFSFVRRYSWGASLRLLGLWPFPRLQDDSACLPRKQRCGTRCSASGRL